MSMKVSGKLMEFGDFVSKLYPHVEITLRKLHSCCFSSPTWEEYFAVFPVTDQWDVQEKLRYEIASLWRTYGWDALYSDIRKTNT